MIIQESYRYPSQRTIPDSPNTPCRHAQVSDASQATTADERPQRPAHARPVRYGAAAPGQKSGETPTAEIVQSGQQTAGYVGLAALLRATGRTRAVARLHQASVGGGFAGTGMAGGKSGDDAGRAAGDIANSFHP